MDREDDQCYFIVASAIIEIVTPLFRKRLQKYIQSRGFGSHSGLILYSSFHWLWFSGSVGLLTHFAVSVQHGVFLCRR
jgi:hypothetical protein